MLSCRKDQLHPQVSQSCIEHRHDLTLITDECVSLHQIEGATAVATRTYSICKKGWMHRSRVPSLRHEQVVFSVHDEKVVEPCGYVRCLGRDIAGTEEDILNLP